MKIFYVDYTFILIHLKLLPKCLEYCKHTKKVSSDNNYNPLLEYNRH